eukprot:TRINITY_DN15627_c0_g1_i1.p1 TRINITY_DN15627_c0_g1~~TRINITY_DN15627_c0_g1_i1.p1  ORF type:complete len:159 (-),score=15.36 TRINITY_DN15627_c0_g1_i1:845-1321(-)
MAERRRTRVWTNRGSDEPCLNQQVEPVSSRLPVSDDGDVDHLIVPRARHLGSASVSFLKITKTRCRRSGLKDKVVRPEVEEQAGREILDIFLAKNGYTDSPPFLGCSPPSRSGNPLIHDVYFVQTKPLGSPPGQSTRVRGSPTPNIRVEGFFSPSRFT